MAAVRGFVQPKFSTVTAVDAINFSIDQGELIGFIGPNGAGKTTTLKTLSGLLSPTSGEVRVLGYEPFRRENAFLKDISLMMGQRSQLLWDLPATDTFSLNQAMYDVPEANYKKILSDLIELLDVSGQLETPVRRLSLGQRMKMELIAALLHSPKVLFLDEPTIGLDIVVQRNLRDFIRDYNQRYNATILLTSHYMGDVQELCKRVIVVSQGKVMFDGELNTLISKYSPRKIIHFVFEKKIPRSAVEQYGTVHNWNLPNISLSVPREDAAKIAGKIMQEHSVVDLAIDETPIEDIIRDIFYAS